MTAKFTPVLAGQLLPGWRKLFDVITACRARLNFRRIERLKKKKKEFILELIKQGLYLQYISLDQYEENSC